MWWPGRSTLAVGLVTLMAGGCTGSPTTGGDAMAELPPDFSLEVLVIGEAGVADETEGRPVHARDGRFVLFADGTLRYGPQVTVALPPTQRVLSRSQMAGLWAVSRDLGLTDAEQADPLVNLQLVPTTAGQLRQVVAFTGHGRRWNYVSAADDPSELDPATTRLVQVLGGLAWAGSGIDHRAMAPPPRYDFGPDPYARFRR